MMLETSVAITTKALFETVHSVGFMYMIIKSQPK